MLIRSSMFAFAFSPFYSLMMTMMKIHLGDHINQTQCVEVVQCFVSNSHVASLLIDRLGVIPIVVYFYICLTEHALKFKKTNDYYIDYNKSNKVVTTMVTLVTIRTCNLVNIQVR